ncbi:MBL fold metallo-hydrolase [Eggerthellaceae bacterium zg-1084]|nr:MBL fold metallo-hydrolase [Berryella wangjianweii]NPD32503.1 MBL fold metallo-hydrolase [Eggerthellaceae bacterium zg-997]
MHVIASGSKGNASVVADRRTGRCVLIDCGITGKNLMEGCAEAGVDPRLIEAVLVTHEHSDHVKGLGVAVRALRSRGADPQVLASRPAVRASSALADLASQVDVAHFAAGDALSLAGMVIHPFATSHDASASFGFRIECAGDALGFLTDSGMMTPAAHDALSEVRVLGIEANHDPTMLRACDYPAYLKARIASDRGHLSNDQCADELDSLLSTRLQHVVALHVSENANTYRAALSAVERAVSRQGHAARCAVGYQRRVVSVG